ncbi:MAG TPA: hypothetical protein PL045_04895 [Chitinophagaceae bacterium]|nr:hypothetical protein [Chitinophagaceae bacterium]
MKKSITVFAISCLLLFSSITVSASNVEKNTLKEKVAAMSEEEKQQRAAEIERRVQEIKSLDKSQLTRLEKKDMRNELRDMNKEAKAIGRGGVYISLAGILIIILVLIIIL